MRGRKPLPLTISSHDRSILEQIARSQLLPWYQVRRARTVLAIAQGQRTGVVAFRMQCDVETVRRTCQRYRERGLDGLLDAVQRPGRPARISPPATGRDRQACLPGADRSRAAHHALDEQGTGAPGS